MRPKKPKVRVWSRESFIVGPFKKTRWFVPYKILNFSKGFSKAFKGKVRTEAQFVVANFLVSQSFVLAAVHVGQV